MTHRARQLVRAFTLTELLIAVVVLMVVIVATARIFGTITTVNGIGQATQDIMQSAGAIERTVREDISNMSRDGVLAIHSVSVVNDVNGARLLDPSKAPDALIRCDQLMFIRDGVQSPRVSNAPGTADVGITVHRAQAAASRVYYGHGVQFPQLQPARMEGANGLDVFAPDQVVNPGDDATTPWFNSTITVQDSRYGPAGNSELFQSTGSTEMQDGVQPDAPDWVLCRQSVLMGHDGGSRKSYLFNISSAVSLLPDEPDTSIDTDDRPTNRPVLAGRIDLAAMQANDLRTLMLAEYGTGVQRPWSTGSAPSDGLERGTDIMASMMRWPRGEVTPPSMSRVDQALSAHVLIGGCSSFQVEWTYAPGVGEQSIGDGASEHGILYDPNMTYDVDGKPLWFGMTDDTQNVMRYRDFYQQYPPAGSPGDAAPDTTAAARTIQPDAVEPPNVIFPAVNGAFDEYWAMFGYNRDRPYETGVVVSESHTPWPTALRITMTLHDPNGRLENGRTFQFVVALPAQTQSTGGHDH